MKSAPGDKLLSRATLLSQARDKPSWAFGQAAQALERGRRAAAAALLPASCDRRAIGGGRRDAEGLLRWERPACASNILKYRGDLLLMSKTSPRALADQFTLRLPDGMRDAIAVAAKANKRSMNAE